MIRKTKKTFRIPKRRRTNVLSINDYNESIHYELSDIDGEFDLEKKREEFEDKMFRLLLLHKDRLITLSPEEINRRRTEAIKLFADANALHAYFEFKYKMRDIDEITYMSDALTGKILGLTDMIDFSDFISFIDKDGNEKPFDNKISDVMFIKINCKDVIGMDNDVIIYAGDDHYLSHDKLSWQSLGSRTIGPAYIDDNMYAMNDGYKSTQMIIQKSKEKGIRTDAASYCSDIMVKTENDTYQGYLPSKGQALMLAICIVPVNSLLVKLGFNTVNPMLRLWTSTEITDNMAYVMDGNTSFEYYSKHEKMYVLPFFKKI